MNTWQWQYKQNENEIIQNNSKVYIQNVINGYCIVLMVQYYVCGWWHDYVYTWKSKFPVPPPSPILLWIMYCRNVYIYKRHILSKTVYILTLYIFRHLRKKHRISCQLLYYVTVYFLFLVCSGSFCFIWYVLDPILNYGRHICSN